MEIFKEEKRKKLEINEKKRKIRENNISEIEVILSLIEKLTD